MRNAIHIGLVTMALCAFMHPATAPAQVDATNLDTIRAGRFDYGKMWTFEYAPAEYFSQTYGFEADDEWFDDARLSALRIPGCSASFVSPHGLVATNHHCVRGAVSRVSREGERLLDRGFYARTVEDERPIPGYYADQLLAIADISDEVFGVVDQVVDEDERDSALGRTLVSIANRLKAEYARSGDSIWVQTIALYQGGRYSAYVFRRFTDVRLVQAVELATGFFGGDPDNFTYPRYALDFAFLRVYDADGEPYEPDHHFAWSEAGVEEGDAVFVIGNPGQTNRLNSVARLEHQRDVEVPALINFLDTRLRILRRFAEAYPAQAEELNLRNRAFGLSNSLKASTGRLEALRDPTIMARKRDAERALIEDAGDDTELNEEIEAVFRRLAEIQQEKARYAAPYSAFIGISNRLYGSVTLGRGLAVDAYLEAEARGAPEDTLAMLREEIARVGDPPAEMERWLLAARLGDFQRFFGPEHEITRVALQGETPGDAADALLARSVLSDAGATREALESDGLSLAEDPVLRLVAAMRPTSREYRRAFNRLSGEETALAARLGRARFAVYGSEVAPDGTFSPRITDGTVRGYEYNGTLAPPYTTFFGLYDRYYGHGGSSGENIDWALPDRWSAPPADLDLKTPLNFVSTADSYGGNSGSPAVTPELELVGLNFDRNVEGLSRDFIYLPERGRNVMVDVRAIRAALDHVYDADRIVAELETGRLHPTEEQADAAMEAGS